MANLLKAKGLHTYRNETNVPEGSMDVADNIIIDEDDVVEVRRGQAHYGNELPLPEDRVKQIAEYKDLLFRHFNDVFQFDNGEGIFSNFNSNYRELEEGLRIKYLEANGNFYFTEETGIKKISASNKSQITANSIENAGVPRAVSLNASVKYTTGGFLPPQGKCAYRVVWGKKDNNGNLLLGYPSERFVLTNTTSTVSINETFQIQVDTVPDNDDIITLSGPLTDYYLFFDTTGSEEAPETPETLGRVGLKVSLLNPSETTNTSASKIANVLADISGFEVSVSSNIVTVNLATGGNVEDVNDYNSLSAPSPNLTTTVLEQGSITDGESSNAVITFSVPSGVDSTYFYQIYRTASVTVPQGLTLDDIEPGDEMNLAYEGVPLDATGALLTEVTIEDITPEDFRASAVFLYTNPISGEGILQANSNPPIAKDITLFNGSTFFSNTKTTHKQTVNLVSVLSMTSGTSEFIISSEDGTRRYTAIGTTHVQDVEVTNTTLNDKALLLESANNEREYFLWLDLEGTGTVPTDVEFDNRIPIRTRYESTDTTDDVATKIAASLAATGDFSVSVLGSVLTISLGKNGTIQQNFRDSSTAATGFTFSTPSTVGTGEDVSNQEFLLSNLVSVAASIDETARSLVKVINADPSSPVNAFYLSGADDVPGIFLLEARSLEDKSFFISTNDTNIIDSFDPSLTVEKTITATTQGTVTTVESLSHGLSTGQEIFISNTLTVPAISGKYEITYVDANNFTIPIETSNDTVNEGEFFTATNESDNEVSPNRLYYSKPFQPESVPLVNYIDIGPRDEQILRILPLRDNLFALKEDGVYIVSGTSAPNFSVRLLDSSVSLLSPDSAVVLNNSIYALSDDGVVRISDTGVEVISRKIEDLIKRVVNSRSNFANTSFGVSYSSDRSYLLWLPTKTDDTVATQCYRYNTFTRTWTRFDISATCGLVADRDDKMHLGSGEFNVITQERKNGDRTDYADREFSLELLPSGVNGNQVRVSTAVDVEEGDVLYQEQYVTIAVFKRLLRKLDIDKLIPSADYFSTISSSFGVKISTQIEALITKLQTDGIIVTTVTIDDDIEVQRDQFNVLIGELNDALSGTGLKDYKEVTDIVTYEMVVEDITLLSNTLTLKFTIPLLEGDVSIFKGIRAKFQYAPQHFGDPSSLKQIRQGTIIFDQNAFYGGIIAYASDQSADFIDTPFTGYGIGDWGAGQWGNGTWGGLGNDIPHRTLVPLEKQRCRYITVQIRHVNAREVIRINGISLMVRALSNRAYR